MRKINLYFLSLFAKTLNIQSWDRKAPCLCESLVPWWYARGVLPGAKRPTRRSADRQLAAATGPSSPDTMPPRMPAEMLLCIVDKVSPHDHYYTLHMAVP